ncbi:hypothetical protein BRD22_10615 [Halobacteriales archaeon SW_8_68_21]|nr:MAG: hypothetical protein BRD22_10615 [Halobacteriales archaeon SW_8_68_21]
MTVDPHANSSPTGLEPITDPDSIRGREGIEFHDDSDVVPAEAVERLTDADDMAIVGVENNDGAVLLRRLTDTCSWKLPVITVGDAEEFATAIRDHVTETIDALELSGIEGVWRVAVESEDGERTAARAFVVFSGTLESDDLSVPEDGVTDAGWFDEIPENGSSLPGTDLFVD